MKVFWVLLESIDEEFEVCVNVVYVCQGWLVVMGIGKSVLVGQKIVVILNFIGMLVLFMYVVDVIYGDFGMIQLGDFVFCLFKSGEMFEICVLVFLFKNFGNVIIGMVGNWVFYLGRYVSYVFCMLVDQEVDFNNLVFIVSIIVQMVLGDVLAIFLLVLCGFFFQDFVQFYLGGVFGKQFYLCVSDFYLQNECFVVQEEDLLQ